jgi:DNA-binding transcriptional LysR family regulator
MNPIQFKNLDLNLFRVLVTLLDHRSVSRAAEELSVTPSAVSHALGRLRAALDDPLFERRGGGLTPTAYALEVGRRVRPSLDRLKDAVNRAEFDPATAEREFVVAASSYTAALLLPPLLAAIEAEAPGLRLRMQRPEDHSADDVEHGRIDLLIGVSSSATGKLEWRPLLSDRMVWVARKGHPFIKAPLTPKMLAEARHVIIEKFGRVISSDYPELRRFFDEGRELGDASQAAARTGKGRASAAGTIVTDVLHAIVLAARTDQVTLTLKRLADITLVGELQVLDPPHRTPPIEFGAIYHPDRARDPGFVWLLQRLEAAAASLDEPKRKAG